MKEHSEKYKSPKQVSTRLERLSGWAVLVGGVIFFAGEVVRQVAAPKIPSSYLVYLPLLILGFLMFVAGGVVNVVEFFRTTRRPFVEHVDQLIAALPREFELIAVLERFDTVALELACERLKLESTKVTSRLGMIGGGEGLRTSLVGVVILVASLISQYESVVHGWTMKSVTFFGVALLLGMSIGGLFVRYGASQADYYSGVIRLTLQRKAHTVRKPHEPISHRLGRKRRTAALGQRRDRSSGW